MPTKIALRALPFFELFDKFIKNSRTGRRLQPDGSKISYGTLANYSYCRQLLWNFVSEKKFELRFRSVKSLDKKQLQVERNYWLRFHRHFTDYLYNDCDHFDNYVGQNMKILRTFFNYLNKGLLLGIGDFHKSFYVTSEQVPIVTLLPEELNGFIYDETFETSLPLRLREAKDVFVFGCTVALRFSDLMALKKTNLRTTGDMNYLIVRSQKTNTDTRIKLPAYAIDILNKYAKRSNRLLPTFNKTDLNLYLKELMERKGFTQVINKVRGKRGKQRELSKIEQGREQQFRFCDLVTTHTMRRTAITTMLSMGMPEQVVRKISGHSPMSKDFFRYVAFAQSYQDLETEKMFEQLKFRIDPRHLEVNQAKS